MATVSSKEAEFTAKIETILSQVLPTDPPYQTNTSRIHGPGTLTDDSKPPFVSTDPSAVQMIHEQVGLLKALHGSCSPSQRPAFVRLLCNQVSQNNVLVVVLTLLHIGHLDKITGVLLSKGPAGQASLRYHTWYALRTALAFEPHRFTDEDLTKLEEIQRRDLTWARMKRKADIQGLPRFR